MPDLVARIHGKVFEDQRNDALADLAQKLIERSRFAYAETVIAWIDEDLGTPAAALLAKVALGFWRQGEQIQAYRLLARALRLLRNEEWKWIIAATMLSIGTAAFHMGQIDWFYSILTRHSRNQTG